MRTNTERGIAMITTMLVLMLMSALLVGFTTLVMSDQRYRLIDRDRNQTFYASAAGIEKLTSDVGNLFLVNVAPTQTDLQNLVAATKKPDIRDSSGAQIIDFTASGAASALPASLLTDAYCWGLTPTGLRASPRTKTPVTVGANGYTITYCADNATNKPTTSDVSLLIKSQPYDGLMGLQTPYQIDVTAKSKFGNGEVHLVRTMEAVSIPVFQFGVFSDNDLSFFAAGNFAFGGRVHTNGNLWLAEGNGQTLTNTGKSTAVGEVYRQYLSNGVSIDDVGMTGTVMMAQPSGGSRSLLRTEGSRVGGPGSAVYANWQTLSLNATTATPPGYAGYLRNGTTGAKVLSLPLTAPGVGGTNADLIRRPKPGEDTTSLLFGERLFTKASLRILLSDTQADITNIPSIDTTRLPVALGGIGVGAAANWTTAPPNNGTPYGPVDPTHPPIGRSPGPASTTTALAYATAGSTTIRVAAIPAMYAPPTLSVGPSLVAVTCTGRTTTSFTNCNVPSNLTSNWTISATPYGSNTVLTAALNGAVTAGANRTLLLSATPPVGGQTSTAAFAPNTFYATGTDGKQVPVTCTGEDGLPSTVQFTGCTGAPILASGASIDNGYLSAQNTASIGGYIKIERQDADSSWHDVTMEILNYGIGGPNLDGYICTFGGNPDPTPNAIVRLQRLRDNGLAAGGAGPCPVYDLKNSYDWIPNSLFDAREGTFRDADPGDESTGLRLNGVMYYVTVDVKNLAKWFRAAAPYNTGTGGGVKTDNGGYTLYFSDRRNNRNPALPAGAQETAEYGFEDVVNPGVAGGVPNGTCDAGEDVNGDNVCDRYGQYPTFDGNATVGAGWPALNSPLDSLARPTTRVKRGYLQVNRPILFRRALKLINGRALNNAPTVAAERISGLTVVSENPVYIQGNWNAYDAASFAVGAPHAATAVIADAVTILSTNWNDTLSFELPYCASQQGGCAAGRLRLGEAGNTANTYYRVAILGGKPPLFNKPGDLPAGGSVFGTDGGAHNFLRMLEGDTAGTPASTTVNYQGSMATLYFSRQATGTFKCCSGTAEDGIVYSVPQRAFQFDTDFTVPALLPPNTPMFRDMDVVGFSQELRPGK